MKQIVKVFVVTFLSLALLASVLNFGFNVSLEAWYWKVVIFTIMIGVPTFYYFKNEKGNL